MKSKRTKRINLTRQTTETKNITTKEECTNLKGVWLSSTLCATFDTWIVIN